MEVEAGRLYTQFRAQYSVRPRDPTGALAVVVLRWLAVAELAQSLEVVLPYSPILSLVLVSDGLFGYPLTSPPVEQRLPVGS